MMMLMMMMMMCVWGEGVGRSVMGVWVIGMLW
jgi:hypothetical protein